MTVVEGMQSVGKADSLEAPLPERVPVAERAAHSDLDRTASLDGGSLLSEVQAATLAETSLSECLPPHFAAPWAYAPSSGADRHAGLATGVTVAA
jgi:hypothetical protein